MEQMRKYPLEFTKPLLVSFDLLNKWYIGFFDENVPFMVKYWRLGCFLPFVLVHYLSITVYMIKISSEGAQVSEFAFMLAIYLIKMQCILKVWILVPKKSDVSQLIMRLGSFWRIKNLSENQIRKKNNLLKKIQMGLAVFYWGTIAATGVHFIPPLLYALYQRIILNQNYELHLPFGGVFPFDPVSNIYIYIVMHIFQTYMTYQVSYLYIGTEFLMITLSSHLTIQFALLREDILEVAPADGDVDIRTEDEQRQNKTNLKEFIYRHQNLIELTKKLDNIFNRLVFIDLLFATVINCFLCFSAVITHGIMDKVNHYIGVFSLTVPIFVMCYYSQLLSEESGGVADSAYENLWYQRNHHYQKIISYIIMRSQKPCSLTSLEYAPITLNTFSKVVSTTWSYLSLAMSVYSEE